MAVQSAELAYKGEIRLAFDYKENENTQVVRYEIDSERITYLMIEYIYENERILPVIYLSVAISGDIFSKVVNTKDTSEFYLRIRKKNALSRTSIYEKTIEDTFSYVLSTTNANYAENLNSDSTVDSSYQRIMIGLVSSGMTNELRKNFNGVYRNITVEQLVKNVALEGIKNLICADIKYNTTYPNILIPPLSSRYKLLNFIFQKYAFFDSYFTFFMDFNNTYLIPKNGEAVSSNDGKPDNVILNIKDYTASDAYTDGFKIENGAYVINVNASDTNVIVNNSTDKVTNNIVAYSDTTGKQELDVVTNTNSKNTTKTIYIRSDNAAAIKNELQSSSVVVELLKQNLDSTIFTPNKSYDINHYVDYEQYNGKYYLAYKREFYYLSTDNEFLITCNIGLKKANTEEVARALKNAYSPSIIRKSSGSSKISSTAAQKGALTTKKATRRKKK